MKRNILLVSAVLLAGLYAGAQYVGTPPDIVIALTSEWKGERLPDGRPKVPDEILERLKNVSVEEASGVLGGKGYRNQYEGNWHIIHPDSVMTGRVVTAQYMPLRPDYQNMIRELGIKENRAQKGGTNSWPIDILTTGDVYVADGYGKIEGGTLIGDNLGNSIYANSRRGVIFHGSVRDEEGLSEIKGFNAWIRGSDPSGISQMMLTSINAPIRIGRATVLPGDVVLAKKYGVVFIPAHLVEELVKSAEITALCDEFGHQRLIEKKYLPGQIDSRWTDDIYNDFWNWLKNYRGKLYLSVEEIKDHLQKNE